MLWTSPFYLTPTIKHTDSLLPYRGKNAAWEDMEVWMYIVVAYYNSIQSSQPTFALLCHAWNRQALSTIVELHAVLVNFCTLDSREPEECIPFPWRWRLLSITRGPVGRVPNKRDVCCCGCVLNWKAQTPRCDLRVAWWADVIGI